ncbi:MAG: helix-turn-helix domain-containing protein [Candidatus Ornithomonoglobus sp.]
MKKKLLQFFGTMFKGTFQKIMLIMFMPVVILLAAMTINNIYHLNSYKSLIIENYTSQLNKFLNDTEADFDSIISGVSLYPDRTASQYIFSLDTKPTIYDAYNAMYSLKNAKNSSLLIDSVVIYNKKGNFVVTQNSVYDANDYFQSISVYDKYPYSYWKDYKSMGNHIKMLDSSAVSSYTDSANTIIPFVYSPNGSASQNLIIYNISANKILQNFEMCKFTRDTRVFMTSRDGTEIVGLDGNTELTEALGNRSKTLFKTLRSNSKISYINSEKVLIIESTKRSGVWGYSYSCIVPYYDITRQTYHILLISVLSITALCIVLMLYIMFGSKTLYDPWKKLVKVAKTAVPGTGDNLTDNDCESFIERCFTNIALAQKKITHDYSRILPLSQERYLIKILNNTTDDADFETLSFKYDYFMALCINVTINPKFETNNDEINLDKLKQRVADVIYNIFSDSYITYRLPISSNNLYLLLNLKDDECMDDIAGTINDINDMLAIDMDDLSIIFGIGNIYSGCSGIKMTHHEALSSLAEELNSTKIKFSPSYYHSGITPEHENMLSNYLTAGYIDKAYDLLDNIYQKISDSAAENKKNTYFEIVNTVEKVVHQKNIHIDSGIRGSVTDMLKSYQILDESVVQSYISGMIEHIAEIMQTYSSKLDINAVVDYINEHFCDDIVLDDIADKFETSSKYLSKRIKQHLGVPYKEYLTRLRMDRAKELLENTDITINELYSAVGFANRSAFTRAFKLSTGLSPSEYKTTHGNKKM